MVAPILVAVGAIILEEVLVDIGKGIIDAGTREFGKMLATDALNDEIKKNYDTYKTEVTSNIKGNENEFISAINDADSLVKENLDGDNQKRISEHFDKNLKADSNKLLDGANTIKGL